jgi:hypothetical protein
MGSDTPNMALNELNRNLTSLPEQGSTGLPSPQANGCEVIPTGDVWQLYDKCRTLLAKIIPLIPDDALNSKDRLELNDALGKLVLWGEPFDGEELGKAFEKFDELRNTTLSFLISVATILTYRKEFISRKVNIANINTRHLPTSSSRSARTNPPAKSGGAISNMQYWHR